MASLDTVPLTGADTTAFTYTLGVFGAGVQSFDYIMPAGPSSEGTFAYFLDTFVATTFCWDGMGTRLLNYLGRPFIQTLTSLLGWFMRTLARELTICTETVSFTDSTDARGTGNFTLEVRFQPISAVTVVKRVDENGATLETYTVTGYDGRLISVTGSTSPKAGDRFHVSYSYTHEGLEFNVTQALAELNILTATGDFLDRWGVLLNVGRIRTGKYGTMLYGSTTYGTAGTESDGNFSRRIIATVTGSRNTPTAILAAVQKLTGGSPYIVEWAGSGGHRGFIFRPTGTPVWMGEETAEGTRHHLIWGKTARFINHSVSNGGAYVFEVWVPSGSGLTASQLLTVVNALKPAGSKAYIRYF